MQDLAATPEVDQLLLERAASAITHAYRNGSVGDFQEIETLALRVADIQVDLPRQAKLVLDAARVGYLAGRPYRAIFVAHCAYDMAVALGAQEDALDAHLLIGKCAADTGDIAAAMLAYEAAFALANTLRDAVRERRVWRNLGVTLMYSGLYRDALLCFERALSADDADTKEIGAINTYSHIGRCHINLGQFAMAAAALDHALALSVHPADALMAHNRAIVETNYTRLNVQRGDDSAYLHAKQARAYADTSRSVRASIYASVAEGLVGAVAGDAPKSIETLTGILAFAEKNGIATREIIETLIKVYEIAANPLQAQHYIDALLVRHAQFKQDNTVRNMRNYLLRHTSAAMANNGSKRGGFTTREITAARAATPALAADRLRYLENVAMSAEAEADPSGHHIYRVGRLAGMLAEECQCDADEIRAIEIGGRLHDIGKVCIPDALRGAETALALVTRAAQAQHTTEGVGILAKAGDTVWGRTASEIVRSHHEWWNGTGFPEGLSGELIPLSARIVALADVFDSLTHVRDYRAACTIDAALAQIKAMRGRQFDPTLADVFFRVVDRLRRENTDLDAYLSAHVRPSPLRLAMSHIQPTMGSARFRPATARDK